LTILEPLSDPQLLGAAFPDATSWSAWRVFLSALFGLLMGSEDDLGLYRSCTGRPNAPTVAAREAWVIVGRRGGKSRVAALIAVYLAAFRDYAGILAPGERATIPVVAVDRRQSRTVLRYVQGFFEASPMLARLVADQTQESIELTNRVAIEIHTCSFRSVKTRGPRQPSRPEHQTKGPMRADAPQPAFWNLPPRRPSDFGRRTF
jgi:hypothetical protein